MRIVFSSLVVATNLPTALPCLADGSSCSFFSTPCCGICSALVCIPAVLSCIPDGSPCDPVDPTQPHSIDCCNECVAQASGISICESSSDMGGDPHVKPWNTQQRYFFMGECDVVFHTSALLEIHARTTVYDFYSSIETVAIRVGETILEMSKGNTHTFYINGREYSDDDLPMLLEGTYQLRYVKPIHEKAASIYALELENITVELRILKSLLGIDMRGFNETLYGSGGLIGSYPQGDLLARDGRTLIGFDDVIEAVSGRLEPVSNAMGMEWQVRSDTDPLLFRHARAPVWPDPCIFPDETRTTSVSRNLRADAEVEAAGKVCAEFHPVDTPDFDVCVLDVLALHDQYVAEDW